MLDMTRLSCYNNVKTIAKRRNGENVMTISERIFKLMEERGLTQMEFSRRTGITQSTISDWKRKKTNPAADKIMTICEALNVSPYEILQDTVDRNNQVEYRVVTPGTDNFDLLIEIETLNPSQKDRLKGYLSAISEKL